MKTVTNGRLPKTNSKQKSEQNAKEFNKSPTFIMLVGAFVCTAFLCLSLSSAPASQITMSGASTAVSAKLSENDAVAVFLGLDSFDIDDAVYVMNQIGSEEDIYVDAPREPKPWSLWGYMAEVIRGLLPPELNSAG